MTGRGLSFGAAAVAYERFRPGYPDAVVDEVLRYATRPVRSALEIGAGTGKATRAFVRRGISLTATDPDPAMLAELHRQVQPEVATMAVPFEQLPTDRTYDLVFSAASLHWTSAAGRWERVAALLTGGGVFANLGGPFELADPRLAAAVAEARSRVVSDEVLRAPEPVTSGPDLRWPGSELAGSPLFTDVRQIDVPRRLQLSPDDYLGHLGTISAFLVLSDTDRQTVSADIRTLLPEQVPIAADLTVHLARSAV
ncbi:class I SAM-dependent methyltransferase [uncultured Jatrophihabitans sp.]|uniref:class I SAM-dependent methyltransferase n=1 Tax=uncultured Jatrophihabitans sp. TaxID=1610747 RepID=UPI0035CC3CDB